MRSAKLILLGIPLSIVLGICFLMSCQKDDPQSPAIKSATTTVLNYNEMPQVPRPPSDTDRTNLKPNVPIDDSKGSPSALLPKLLKTTFVHHPFGLRQEYSDGSTHIELTIDALMRERFSLPQDADNLTGSCGGGSGRVCMKCSGKNWLCVEGIPQGCSTWIESDGCMSIDCSSAGCPSYNVCCSSYFTR